MIEFNLTIHDEAQVPGAGPGGTPKDMHRVTLDGDEIGFIARRMYQREGGVYEAFLGESQTPFMRDPNMEVLAFELASRRKRKSAARQQRAL